MGLRGLAKFFCPLGPLKNLLYNTDMSKDAKTVLEWTYEPVEFFEEPFTISSLGGTITISQGQVKGEFDSSYYEQGRKFRDKLHEQVGNVFLAQQVQIHKAFKLSSASMAREHPGGRRDVTVFAEPITLMATVGQPDFIFTNYNGEVVQDTRAERLKKQQNFRDNVSKLLPKNLTLKRMLQSFQNALSDQDNLFIHLYEVREALVSEFGGEAKVKQKLGISSANWSNFGQLANNEPILEGRHRGKHTGLRPANATEKDWALNFSQMLIEAYVDSVK